MSVWERIDQKRRAEEQARRDAERRAQEAQNQRAAEQRAQEARQRAEAEARNREALERGRRANSLLESSGAVRDLKDIRGGIRDRFREVEVSPYGNASLNFGSSDVIHSQVSVSADPEAGTLNIHGRVVPAGDRAAVKDAIADAFLDPRRVDRTPYSPPEPEKWDCCHCLSKGSKILTPSGYKSVEKLKLGDSVMTVGRKGKLKSAIITKQVKIKAGNRHVMLRVVLMDGSVAEFTPTHPDINGISFIKSLHSSDLIKQIKEINLIKYNSTYTYDILPEGSTGAYIADGVLLGSTLSPNFQHSSCSSHIF